MKEVAELVWRLDSGRPGKKLMVLGGVHGNETPGITVVRELLGTFIDRTDDLVAGSLTLAFGNPHAIVRGMRGSAPHRDLNRCFDDAHLPDIDADAYELRRVAELSPFIDEADVLIDLHSTNKPSAPFMCVTSSVMTPDHVKICDLFDCDRLVSIDPVDMHGTTIGRINERGGLGVAFESGMIRDGSRIGTMHTAVRRALVLLGMTSYPDIVPTSRRWRLFLMMGSYLLTEKGFSFAKGFGTRSFETVFKGDVFGYEGDTAVRAPYSGVLMFPKVESLWKVGSPVVFFAKDAGLTQP